MKRQFRGAVFSLLALFGMVGGALPAGAGVQSAGNTAAYRQPVAPTIAFAPITLADIGPIGTSRPSPSWIGISGDWVAYAIGRPYCGHCGVQVSSLHVQNVITGLNATIKPSSGTGQGSDLFQTASNFQFAGGKLVWQQPTVPMPGESSLTPGDFSCATCYYDVTTKQGGEWTGNLPADPPSDFVATAEPGPPPTYEPMTFKVVQKSTNRLVVNGKMDQYQRAGNIVVGVDKVVFVQSEFVPQQGSLGSPQQLKLQWLVAPDPAFASVWNKADGQVAAGKVSRSWLWGPAPSTTAKERYEEGPGGTRLVQYFDKSRMEVNNPGGNRNDPFFVTNGLLATEMIAGEIQIGNLATITASVPCTIPVAGDPLKDNPLTPSYATLAKVASLHGENQAQNRNGQFVSQSIDVNGVVGVESANGRAARYAAFVPETGHNVPDIFLGYLQGMRATYGFDWTFVLGYPITEAYWTKMRVSGKDMPVMIQAYQRRVLTYVPDFPAAWQIQQGNVGQHYFEWRYLLQSPPTRPGP